MRWSLNCGRLFNGFGVLAILLVYPSGLGGILYDLRDAFLRRVAAARGIHVPSLVADSRTDGGAEEATLEAVAEHGDHVEELERAHRDGSGSPPPVEVSSGGGRR